MELLARGGTWGTDGIGGVCEQQVGVKNNLVAMVQRGVWPVRAAVSPDSRAMHRDERRRTRPRGMNA